MGSMSAADLRARASAFFSHGRCRHCGHAEERHYAEPVLDNQDQAADQWKLVCFGPLGGEQCRCRILWSSGGEAYVDPNVN